MHLPNLLPNRDVHRSSAALTAATPETGRRRGLAALMAVVTSVAVVIPVMTAGSLSASAAPSAIKKVAKIGSATYPIAGTNIARDVNALVAYTTPMRSTPTNQWGVEVKVVNGKVTAVRNREATQRTTGVKIPANGYVLSGHYKAADWLLGHATVGAAVGRGGTAAGPVKPRPVKPRPVKPRPKLRPRTGAPMPLPSSVVSMYHMMWSNSGSPQLRNVPSKVNVLNLAFLQGDAPSLVGWASQSQASFIAAAKAMRARGVRIVASVGGSGGRVNIANRSAFIHGVMALNAKLPLDGLDWDLEGTAMRAADVVYISKRLKQLRGSAFSITMAPNGSNIDQYRSIAVQLQKVNALDLVGQQFYDAVVSKEAANGRVAQLVAAGIPQSRISIGMMVGNQSHYWTVAECMTAVNYIKRRYPNIRGGYLWESGRAGTADWVNRVGPLLRR